MQVLSFSLLSHPPSLKHNSTSNKYSVVLVTLLLLCLPINFIHILFPIPLLISMLQSLHLLFLQLLFYPEILLGNHSFTSKLKQVWEYLNVSVVHHFLSMDKTAKPLTAFRRLVFIILLFYNLLVWCWHFPSQIHFLFSINSFNPNTTWSTSCEI